MKAVSPQLTHPQTHVKAADLKSEERKQPSSRYSTPLSIMRRKIPHRAVAAGLTAAFAATTVFAAPAGPPLLNEATLAAERANASAEKAESLRRIVNPKPLHTQVRPGFSTEHIQLKLADGTDAELRNGKFFSEQADVAELNFLLAAYSGHRIVPTLTTAKTPVELRRERREVEARAGHQLADLSLYFSIKLEGASAGTTEKLIDRLNALSIVEAAEPVPKAAPPPSADYQPYQNYLGPAPIGIGATTVNGIAGVHGDYVQITDIEFNWNISHEDLAKARASGAFIQNGTPDFGDANVQNHGTAVLGELIAANNGSGVTGIAYNSRLRMVNAQTTGGNYSQDLANAVTLAGNNSAAGDVILIEQQIQGAVGRCDATAQDGCVPVESISVVFAAIQNVTAKGIIVVEAAGNGGQDLNSAVYSNWNSRDSGAIIVGAGAGNLQCAGWSGLRPHSRLSFSNYGNILDLQGWGECVTTTGYGDASGGTNANLFYTYKFNGTSSASPIVAAAAAAYSSVMKARTGQAPNSRQVRQALASTGTPQDTAAGTYTGNIGPLPNLQAALSNTDTTPPTVTAPVENIAIGTLGTTVPTTVKWSASDASGIKSYELWISTNGGTFVRQTGLAATATSQTYLLTPGNTYQFFVRAYDNAGNASLDNVSAYGPAFKPALTDDRATTVQLFTAPGSTTSTWAYASYAPAYKGTVTKSIKAKESARYTFTGRDVALVASVGTSRGNAQILLDGVFSSNVQLYKTTNAGSQIVFWAHWPTSGSHTIEVQNRAVSGLPTAIDIDGFIVER